MADRMYAYKVVVFYTGSDAKDDGPAILYEGSQVAPSAEVAQLLAAWKVETKYQDASKAAKLEISATPLA